MSAFMLPNKKFNSIKFTKQNFYTLSSKTLKDKISQQNVRKSSTNCKSSAKINL